MTGESMTGSIMRGIGSFYTVLCDEDGQEYTLRWRPVPGIWAGSLFRWAVGSWT